MDALWKIGGNWRNEIMDDDEEFDDDLFDDEDDETSTVPCPACGIDVYEQSEQCPACGEFITFRTTLAPIWRTTAITLVVLFVAYIAWWLGIRL